MPAAPDTRTRLRRFARLAAPLLHSAAAMHPGQHAARERPGNGVEFLDLAEYSPGADLRHLDWARSRTRGRPTMRRYRDEVSSDWVLCVDVSASMAAGHKWLQACDIARALAYAVLFAGHRVALCAFADSLTARCTPGRGQATFTAVCRTLDGLAPARRGGASRPAACAPHVRQHANVVVVSDLLRDDVMLPDLARLAVRAGSAHAIQVLAEDETALPSGAPVKLIDCESGASRVLVPQADATRAALESYCRHLHERCTVLGIRSSRAHDVDNWERVLLQHFGARSC